MSASTIEVSLEVDSGSGELWVLPSDVTAPAHARRHVVGVCAGMPTERVDIARLLVTELVANAVLHGAGTVLLVVARNGGGLRVEVYDESPELPVLVDAASMMEHGAGLRLVAALATSWGTSLRNDAQPGKLVWFALD